MTDPAPAAGSPRARTGRRRFLAKRLAIVPLTLLIVVTLSFLLIALIPQSTALAIAGEGATQERVLEINRLLGLDRPLPNQFLRYLGRIVHGDLGTSFYSGQSVLNDMFDKLPATLELVIPALLLALVLGIGFGTLAGYYAGRSVDGAVRTVGSALQAMPDFLVGLLLLYFLFYKLRWAPLPSGRLSITTPAPPERTGLFTIDSILAGEWGTFADAAGHLVLPVLTIAVPISAVLARITRATTAEAFGGKHAEYARALGLPERTVIRYVLVDCRTALLTFTASCVAGLVGGQAIVETLFNWNGLGKWSIDAMINLDPPQIQGVVLFSGITTLLVFIALDLISMALDPRIDLEQN